MKKSLLVFAFGLAVWSDCAYTAARPDVARVASRRVGERTQLHQAAQDGKAIKCRELLAEGKDIEAVDENGRTPLLTAAAHSSFTVIKELLAAGANAKARDAAGFSAVGLALSTPWGWGREQRPGLGYVHFEILKVLLEAGAKATEEEQDFIRRAAEKTLTGCTREWVDVELVDYFKSY